MIRRTLAAIGVRHALVTAIQCVCLLQRSDIRRSIRYEAKRLGTGWLDAAHSIQLRCISGRGPGFVCPRCQGYGVTRLTAIACGVLPSRVQPERVECHMCRGMGTIRPWRWREDAL